MTQITPISIKFHTRGFCSQNRRPLATVRTIEEGVLLIKQILAKDILCKHDIQDCNSLYAAIDRLERQVDKIPDENSQSILQQIIAKTEKIFKYKLVTAQEWIWLYHSKDFSYQPLELQKNFKLLSSQVKNGPHKLKEIAIHLPYCISKEQFNEDVKALIGDTPTDDVAKILNRKRAKIDYFENCKTEIEIKKQELRNLRQASPKNYPSYFDELIENGYFHLYNHLLEMQSISDPTERRAKIEALSFSALAHIVLQTREAIIQKVEKSIHVYQKNILFLVGGSGAGKSTTLCFLRGDQLILKDFQYTPKTSQNSLISDDAAVSCTFLPTIEVINHLVIVDFPGFEDSNGPFVSLGMEFALKALISQYRPKILVVESITNDEGRLAAARQLGYRLERLIENKKDCFLGLTKYSKDPHFIKIQTLEENQKKELLKPSHEEIGLEANIKMLSDLNMPGLEQKIQTLQQELSKLREEKKQNQIGPLPDTEEKKTTQGQLETKEKKLQAQIGLGQIIRFWKLENQDHHNNCLTTLSDVKIEGARPKSQQVVRGDDKDLINHIFKFNLKQIIEKRTNLDIELKDFKNLLQKILESSLINIIFSQTNPEIGEFLHLPEMDLSLVRDYDKKVVGSCIKKYIESIIKEFNIPLIKKILQEVQKNPDLSKKVSKEKTDLLEQKLEKLIKYVLGLLGSLPEDDDKADATWNKIQTEHKTATEALEKSFELPTWVTVIMCIPIGIPYGIRKLYEKNEIYKQEQDNLEKLISKSCQDLDEIYATLVGLKEIEKVIAVQEQLDEALNSLEISLESEKLLVTSIQNKINRVRSIYGSEDWDQRIEVLKEEYNFLKMQIKALSVSQLNRTLTLLLDDKISFTNLPSIDYSKLRENLTKTTDKDSFLFCENFILHNKNISDKIQISINDCQVGINSRSNFSDFLFGTTAGVFLPILATSLLFGVSNGYIKYNEISIEDAIKTAKNPLSRAMLAAALLSLWKESGNTHPQTISAPTFTDFQHNSQTTTTTANTQTPIPGDT